MQTINFKKLKLKQKDLVLDMGCGEGRHAISLHAIEDNNSVAFDLSYDDVKIAKDRLLDFDTSQNKSFCQFGVGDIDNLSFKDNSYDVVICSEVLEHVEDPEIALKELARVLKTGGKLAVSVPRFFPEWLCWKISDEYSKTPGGHVRIFRHNQLKEMVKKNGLIYDEFHWAHSLHSPYWWLKCLFWNIDPEPFVLRKYHQFLVWDLMKQPLITRILEKLLQPFIGKSLVMYFTKK